MSDEQIEELRDKNDALIKVLKDIILSCAHPREAFRCVMVDLKPIRKALKDNGITDKNLGID